MPDRQKLTRWTGWAIGTSTEDAESRIKPGWGGRARGTGMVAAEMMLAMTVGVG
jgi:hypothetical protein